MSTDRMPNCPRGTGIEPLESRRLLAGGPLSHDLVGDVTSDGKADVVTLTGNRDGAVLSVARGNGSGQFAPAYKIKFEDVMISSFKPALADFNGDGNADLLTTRPVPVQNPGGARLAYSLMPGNGDGTFAPPVNNILICLLLPSVQSFAPVVVKTGDVGGGGGGGGLGGLPDVLAYTPAAPGRPATVSTFLNEGGGFATAVTTPVQGLPADVPLVDIVVAPVDQDSTTDLAFVFADGSVRFLTGNGDGTFSHSPSSFDFGGPVLGVAVGDFNNDGRPDLVVMGDGSVRLFRATGYSILPYIEQSNLLPYLEQSNLLPYIEQQALRLLPYLEGDNVAVGDVNGDGNLDLLLRGFGDRYLVLYGNGAGAFHRLAHRPDIKH